jgi:hypothetical protein
MISQKTKSITIVEALILIALISTPIFTFQESISLILPEGRAYINTSSTITHMYIKGIKDLFFISIILICFLKIIDTLSIRYSTAYFLMAIFLLILLPAYYCHSHTLVYLAGVRWLLPFILIAFLFGHIDKELLERIGTILFYLFIFHFIFQVIQFIFSYGYFGLNSIGLSKRSPGIFYIPSTAAVFSIITLFFSKFYMRKNLEKKIFYLIPISILLTSSGTGVAVYIFFFVVYYIQNNYLKLLPIILVFSGIVLLIVLDYFPGRTGLVEQSLGPRYVHLKQALIHATFLPQYFGYGTSTIDLINNKFNTGLILPMTDSFLASFLVNLGIINTLLVTTLLTVIFFKLVYSQDKEMLIFLIIFSLIALTTSITESYPVNLLFSVLVAYYVDPKNYNERRPNKSVLNK